MKELAIEWRHYEKDGSTCERCAATGKTVKEVVSDLAVELSHEGISIRFLETTLPAEAMAQSNLILLNGTPLEQVLDNASSAVSDCPSCACLTGSQTSCRTVEHGGVSYEEIPAELIRKAVFKLAGLDQG